MFIVIRKGAINAVTEHKTYQEAEDTVKLEGSNWNQTFKFFDQTASAKATGDPDFYQAWNIYLKPATKRELEIRSLKQALVGIDQAKYVCRESADNPHLTGTVTKEIQSALFSIVDKRDELPYYKLFRAIDLGIRQQHKAALEKDTNSFIKFEHNGAMVFNPFSAEGKNLSYEMAVECYGAEKVNRWIDQAFGNRNRQS